MIKCFGCSQQLTMSDYSRHVCNCTPSFTPVNPAGLCGVKWVNIPLNTMTYCFLLKDRNDINPGMPSHMWAKFFEGDEKELSVQFKVNKANGMVNNPNFEEMPNYEVSLTLFGYTDSISEQVSGASFKAVTTYNFKIKGSFDTFFLLNRQLLECVYEENTYNRLFFRLEIDKTLKDNLSPHPQPIEIEDYVVVENLLMEA